NFTKGSDGWDPLSALIADETTGLLSPKAELDVDLTVLGETLHVNGVQTPLQIQVYNLQGSLQARYFVSGNTVLSLSKGFWIIRATAGTQQKIMKVWIP
ncbi:MAG TPA: T9SS type A sorting domain-containing protein, partial [Bacteroidales bacterium]|nr:T9SS type A sorting domain-containing protein [Bacteroidales bacterium]